MSSSNVAAASASGNATSACSTTRLGSVGSTTTCPAIAVNPESAVYTAALPTSTTLVQSGGVTVVVRGLSNATGVALPIGADDISELTRDGDISNCAN